MVPCGVPVLTWSMGRFLLALGSASELPYLYVNITTGITSGGAAIEHDDNSLDFGVLGSAVPVNQVDRYTDI